MKLFIAVLIPIVLLGVSQLRLINGIGTTTDGFVSYLERDQVRLNALNTMYGDGLLSGVATRNLIFNPSLKQPPKVVAKTRNNFESALQKVRELTPAEDTESHERLDTIAERWSVVANTREEVLKLAQTNRTEEASQMLAKVENPAWRAIRINVQALLKKQSEANAELRTQVIDQAFSTKSEGIILSVLAIGIGVILVVLATLGILRRINQTTLMMTDIGEGEGDLTRRLDDSRDDELGVLAHAFNKFVAKIQGMVQNVSNSTSQLASSSEQLTGITEQADQSISRQKQQLEQVATAMNEMVATVNDVARNATEAATAAREAEQQANNGQNVVNSAIEAMRSLAADVESAAEVVRKLDQNSQAIGTVLDVIRDIAEQTNLLALNAAIEAARAGDQGRGFAVVADEVRTLASRTQESTSEIQEMIESLQTGANHAVEVMEQSRTRANNSMETASGAQNALSEIISSVASITDMNNMIASAAEEQSSVVEEMDRNVNNINDAAEQTMEITRQSARSGDELAGLATDLKLNVQQFKI
ncbi:MAG: methyl-accepting chemotaxis protein [Gammaproteobacteria bacterium]|nr:methyl-accepting chemotaxis protein [Gammaproteobacteria bacterium]